MITAPASIVSMLVVEDNNDDVLLLREALDTEMPGHFQLTQVGQLHEALKCLCQRTFDVIMLDLNLPDSFGSNTFAHIRTTAERTPIIIYSGDVEKGLRVMASLKGGEEFVYKGTFNGPALTRAILKALSGGSPGNFSME